MLRSFKEYLEVGIVRKRSLNINRAENLIKNSKGRKDLLDRVLLKVEIKESDANYIIEQVYDILIELIRAKLFLDGFEASGNNAHEAEVSYLKELNFLDEEISLMNELRTFRNGVKYYGKQYTLEQSELSIKFLNSILPKLKKILKLT